MVSVPVRAGIVLGFLLSALGCASGPRTLRGYKVPERQQVAIVLDISDQVNAADQGGGVATLADTLSNRLREAGIDSQLYTSKYDHPHAPRVDLYVRHWQTTPESSRNAARLGALVPAVGVYSLVTWSPNEIVVDCSVTLAEQAKPTYSRRFTDTVLISGSSENSGNIAAENAANAIADEILQR